MKTHAVVGAVLAMVLVLVRPGGAEERAPKPQALIRTFDRTIVVGESDPAVWRAVLEVLPIRPPRIEVLDVGSLSPATQQKLRGLEAFVLAGSRTIVVIRQGATLRHAESGDAVDRLVLASLVWHELAHVNGLDERAAFAQERWLWRRFIASGLVEGALGLAYIARLANEGTAPIGRNRQCRGWGSNPHALSGPGF
jgi:hypothetical protein